MKSFASDNNSGVHPRIIQSISKANIGTVPAYGDDRWTAEAVEQVKLTFGENANPWFVFLGTAANVLGLKCLVKSHEAIICANTAHINCDECGAPEAISGSKLLQVPSHAGKVNLAEVEPLLSLRESVHHVYPRVLFITQATEMGTLYSVEELAQIGAFCKKYNLYFHMDGARLSNAAAAMGVSLKAISTDVGVDVLSFGGTKNGLMAGEVVVFLNPALGHDFPYYRKQHMQLGSKMRFVTTQFTEYLKDGLWLENASAANAATKILADSIRGLPHVKFVCEPEVNAIFARMHKNVIAKLQETFYFYTIDSFNAPGFPKDWQLVRLMTSFDTTKEQVDELAAAIKNCEHLSRV